MKIVRLEHILQFLDEWLEVGTHPDYPNALNGLQVGGPEEVGHVAVAVDTSEQTIEAAVGAGADLLVVHHGLFWDGLRPLTGRRFRKVSQLMAANVALYSAHLPLDSHSTVGNAVLLAKALGVEPAGGFGEYQGSFVGCWAEVEPLTPSDLKERLESVLGGSVHLIQGGEHLLRRIAIVTGGGGSFVSEASSAGFDGLITGEGSHHTYVDAIEEGVHLLYGGHYATETFGVQAVGEELAERFGITWEFLDFPSGL